MNFSDGFFLGDFFGENVLEEFFGRIFWKDFLREDLFWEDFLGGFLGGLFLEELFGRNYLFYFDVEGIDLFVKILIFVKILSQRRRKEEGQEI